MVNRFTCSPQGMLCCATITEIHLDNLMLTGVMKLTLYSSNYDDFISRIHSMILCKGSTNTDLFVVLHNCENVTLLNVEGTSKAKRCAQRAFIIIFPEGLNESEKSHHVSPNVERDYIAVSL